MRERIIDCVHNVLAFFGRDGEAAIAFLVGRSLLERTHYFFFGC